MVTLLSRVRLSAKTVLARFITERYLLKVYPIFNLGVDRSERRSTLVDKDLRDTRTVESMDVKEIQGCSALYLLHAHTESTVISFSISSDDIHIVLQEDCGSLPSLRQFNRNEAIS